MIYDLSTMISNKTVTYPTDPKVLLSKSSTIENCGYNVTRITMGTHSGTHVDLPFHCIPSGTDAATADIENFCGDAVVIEVPFQNGKPVSLENTDTSIIKNGDILIIRTGWEERAGTSGFFREFPYFGLPLTEKLVSLGVKAVGTDMPSVDCRETNGEMHRKLLSNNIMIIEALVNLKPLIGKRCFFSAVPLKIENGDGSPVRAYAII